MFIMRYTVDPRQGRLFDPFAGIIPPLGRKLINAGWQAIFRAVLLALMPAKELGKHFDPAVGRPTKELYSMAGLLFLQETHNWTNAQAVEAYLFRSDVQFALNLEPGQDEQCERTFERYRQLFLEDDLANQSWMRLPPNSSRNSNSTSSGNVSIPPTSSATWPALAEPA